jgi:hypothetical protein
MVGDCDVHGDMGSYLLPKDNVFILCVSGLRGELGHGFVPGLSIASVLTMLTTSELVLAVTLNCPQSPVSALSG